MKLSAMVYVSGYTECINDGSRTNCGIIREDIAEEDAVIIGRYYLFSFEYMTTYSCHVAC